MIVENGTIVYLHCYPLENSYRVWKINPVTEGISVQPAMAGRC
jgi:hypothetical protein